MVLLLVFASHKIVQHVRNELADFVVPLRKLQVRVNRQPDHRLIVLSLVFASQKIVQNLLRR